MPTDTLVSVSKLVEDYTGRRDWRVKDNANKAFSFQGMAGYLVETSLAKYALDNIYTEDVAKAHRKGDFYVHDLAFSMNGYCMGLDLQDLLLRGLAGASGKVSSSPPKHFGAALGQLINFLFVIQQEVAGAVAVSSFDTLLAPLVRSDYLSYDQVKQEIQEFVFAMNQPTRLAFQSPFSNITLDLVPPNTLKDVAVIIGGKPQDSTYGDYQQEMDIINEAFADVMMTGDKSGRPFSFPIPTYNITKEFDWDNPHLSNLWKMTAKYGIPYFANFLHGTLNPDDVRSMCCRLRLDVRELRRRGGLFSSHPLTGSIGVVTINLPRLAFKYQDSWELFYGELRNLMNLASKSLMEKRLKIDEMTRLGMFPYVSHFFDSVTAHHGSAWANHFNSIGLIGMEEAVTMLTSHHLYEEQGVKVAEHIMDFMLGELVRLQSETGCMYNLEATPAESATHVLAKQDRKEFGDDIYTQGEEGSWYYTNSCLLPVGYTHDIIEYMNIEQRLLKKFTGGSVVHVWLGERISDENQAKNLVRMLAEQYDVPYFSLSPTFSVCPKHGYLAGEFQFCPQCDADALAAKVAKEMAV